MILEHTTVAFKNVALKKGAALHLVGEGVVVCREEEQRPHGGDQVVQHRSCDRVPEPVRFQNLSGS